MVSTFEVRMVREEAGLEINIDIVFGGYGIYERIEYKLCIYTPLGEKACLLYVAQCIFYDVV